MEFSMFKELNKKNLQIWINKSKGIEDVLKNQYWVNFFPMEITPFLTYETLIGSEGNRVMADVVSYNSSAPLKTRKAISKLTGSIPSIRVKRQMAETDINKYNAFKAMASSGIETKLLQLVFNDTDDVFDFVMNRLEWIALQTLALGQVELTPDNNAGVVTEKLVDFQLPDANKMKMVNNTDRRWIAGNETTCKPITDIRAVVKAAKRAGANPQYMLMNDTKFQLMISMDEVKDFVKIYVPWGATSMTIIPTKEMLNQALKAFKLPIIIIIDTIVDYENADHIITKVDPWQNKEGSDKHVVFIDDMKCGNMLRGPIAEETNPPKQIVQAKKNGVLISVWSQIDPVSQFTKGEINAFPSCPSIDHIYNLDTEATTWAV